MFSKWGAVMLHQVALVHGISMGGGAALMIPLKFSVVTEKTVSISILLEIIHLNPFWFCGVFNN